MLPAASMVLMAALGSWFRPGTAGMVSVASWPSSWGSSPSTAYESPAGISRIEGIEIATSCSFMEARYAAISAGSKTGPVYAAIDLGLLEEREDPPDAADELVSATLACAWVVTGDPVGFIEGFFGPSIAIGASTRGVFGDDGGDMLLGSAGLQFSVFPTFSIGVAGIDIPLAVPDSADIDVETHWGATYIFSRELRLHASLSGGDTAFGAELAVAPWLEARTGSDGESWNAGASLSSGRFTLDYGVVLDDSSTGHAFSLSFMTGGENWY